VTQLYIRTVEASAEELAQEKGKKPPTSSEMDQVTDADLKDYCPNFFAIFARHHPFFSNK
jgi:hypothetical protein